MNKGIGAITAGVLLCAAVARAEDLTDLAAFQRCYGLDQAAGCEGAYDYNGDGGVDLQDLSELRVRLTGPLTPPGGMVFVSGGPFQMGDPWDEGNFDELPVHTVYLSPYFIDRYELTNRQYADALDWAWGQGGLIEVTDGGLVKKAGDSEEYCDTTTSSSYSRITWNGSTFNVVAGKESHPMVQVSWYGAVAYCNWRSTMEGRQPCYVLWNWGCNFDANGYRLPTEAEWEKAAGWDPTQVLHYRFGEHTDGCGRGCLEGRRANTAGSGDPFENGVDPRTTPVGYYDGTTHGSYATQDARSYYGCYDMSGSVWEMCSDWHSAYYYPSSPGADPRGPATGVYRSSRGGGWYDSPGFSRSADRFGFTPANRRMALGLRCSMRVP